MEVSFADTKLETACASERLGNKLWGKAAAKAVRKWYKMLTAAQDLSDIAAVPSARLHQWQTSGELLLSVSVTRAVRILFHPANDPLPLRADGTLDLSGVTKIRVIFIGDPHRK